MKTLLVTLLASFTLSAMAAGECRIKQIKEVKEAAGRHAVATKTVEAESFEVCLDLGKDLLGARSTGSFRYRTGGRHVRHRTIRNASFETVKVKMKFSDEDGTVYRAMVRN